MNLNMDNLKDENGENFVKNYIKSKNRVGEYIKNNFSFTNINKGKKQISDKKEEDNSQALNTINSNDLKRNRCITKHSSMKYFRISPIINPIYDRAYFTPKINIETTNNLKSKNNNNINIYKVMKKVKKGNYDKDESSSTSRLSSNINKIQSMPIHIMNNINIINNNLVENNNNTCSNNNLVFTKKKIQNYPKSSLSKPKTEKLLTKNLDLEDNNAVYYKNRDNNIKAKFYNRITKENLYDNYKLKKYHNNLFNKTNRIKPKTNIKIEDTNKNNFNISLKNSSFKNINNINISEKDYNTVNNNNNYNNYNYYLDNNDAFKELNLEDFLLIMQKFDDIKNNYKYIYSFYNLNYEQNYVSTKKILKINHVNKIKLYDLFLFYMGSSFDGSPEKLFTDKKSKYYLHIWTVIFIITIGTLFTISQNVNLTDECSQDVLKLISLQEKIFLIFCGMIIEKVNKKYKNNIWVEQIIESLQNKLSEDNKNPIIIIRTLIIDSYEIINNLLLIMNNFNNQQKININIKTNIEFLYNNFYNADWKDLNEITINQIEENFNISIFKKFNIKNTSFNINKTKSYKKSIIRNNFSKTYYTNGNINNNTNKNKNKFFSPEIPKKSKKIINLSNSKNNPKKLILKTSNSNPSLITKNHPNSNSYKNMNIIPQNFIHSNIIQYPITIPCTPPPTQIPKYPFLDFSPEKPYTLVIDLDETMVNFKFTNAQNGIGILYLRPYLENFLEVIKDYYEIIAFTSASRDYADIALDLIEKNQKKKYFSERLYREHTTQIGAKYIKELSKLGRDLSKIIIVDNLSQCFKMNNENGILISSFFGEDENDKALIELQKILIKIYYDKDDVRKGLFKYKDDIFNKISRNIQYNSN